MFTQRNAAVSYDHEAEGLYVKLHKGEVARTVERVVNIDLDADGVPLGIEMLDVPHFDEVLA